MGRMLLLHILHRYSLLFFGKSFPYRQAGRQDAASSGQAGRGGGCLRSAERGLRSAECGGRRADVCGARRECGVRSAECGRPVSAEPAGVCRAGRCLRSVECGSCGVRTADCRPADIRGARTAEYCGLMRSTEFCYLIRQAVLFRQATVGVAQVSEPADTERRCGDGLRNVERSKG